MMKLRVTEEYAKAVTRRHFFRGCGVGVGAMALGSLLERESIAAHAATNPLAPRSPHAMPTAKRVIYLHMAGSPSQLELFDYKPLLEKYDGQACPKEFLEGKRFAFISPEAGPTMLGPRFRFQQCGESGTWISELLPHLAEVTDDLCVVRSLYTTQFNHAPAQLFIHTGDARLGYPSLGSWATYGLGSESQDLPGFVVLVSGGKTPSAGKSVWGSGFLPSVYQGTQCRSTGEPILYLSNPKGLDRTTRRRQLDVLRQLNEYQYREVGDPEVLSRISQYELTYRMQLAAGKVLDISREPQHILDMYGARPGYVSAAEREFVGDKPKAQASDVAFANNCLLARRLVEAGVRFVQLYDWGWDHHGSSQPEDILTHLPVKAAQIDRPLMALIRDLKQRGLLDETLVVWGGEFGRTPMRENRGGSYGRYTGRDHHPFAFTMWMAGGGIKSGTNFGTSDEVGYYPADGKMSVRDLQATILHLLGMDPFRLSWPHQGLDARLIGPTDDARIRKEIIA
jgi:hypothetical protein